MSTVANVTAAKAATAGAVSVAPLTTTLPTTADGALDAAFANLGYVSEDGLTNSNSAEMDQVKAWGGDVVLDLQTGKSDNFQLTLIEAINEDVWKAIYGAANVTGTLANGYTVKADATELPYQAWVIDMVLKGGILKRIVIPNGKITEVGDITYRDNEAVGYEITISALPDASGFTHYEYVKGA